MSKKGAAMTAAATVRLLVGAGKAAPTPPVGPALGQKGVKSMDFCKLFNDQTKDLTPGIPITAIVTVNPDRSFTFVTKTPPTAWFLKQVTGIEKGSARPSETIVAEMSLKHVYEIAKIKAKDPGFVGVPLEKVCSRVIGTARGMGIKVVA
ncbi:mitochondrial ribosomal protein L11 [Entophlyctis helioformis]|nr:mitochondrial ribosomal protein L11 [Entophlyctis helioformis]